MAEVTFTETIIFEKKSCHRCGVPFALTTCFIARRREDHETFYCPNGHPAYFPQDNEAEKLRKELKRKEQELADQVQARLNEAKEYEKKMKKQKNDLKRLTNGVCPCCDRSFVNLANHMKNKHPEAVSKDR